MSFDLRTIHGRLPGTIWRALADSTICPATRAYYWATAEMRRATTWDNPRSTHRSFSNS